MLFRSNQACFGCTIACGRISKIDETHFSIQNRPQYINASGGLEYEAAWALGAANGVNDLEALQFANMVCNEEGMDPISFGATIGALMEMYEMGVLKKEQLGIEDKVKLFESQWNSWLGSKYSLFVSSGSTANLLLLSAIKELYNFKLSL